MCFFYLFFMKIHGAVYVVLGLLMALYARFIGRQVDSGAMVLFFWIGIGFVVFGVFRLIINYVMSDKADKAEKSKTENSKLDVLKKEKQAFENSSNNSYSSQIISCSRCGTRHYSNSNFCHMCGLSLKK